MSVPAATVGDVPTSFSIKPTLEGERVVLRPFTAADIDAMAAVLADPDVNRLTGSVHTTAEATGRSPVHDDATRRWYGRVRSRTTGSTWRSSTGRPTGAWARPCSTAGSRRTGRAASGSSSARRAATVASGRRPPGSMLRHAFTATDLYRVELSVFAFNPRARHVYERAGFVVEGVRRDAFVFDGERVDDVLDGRSCVRSGSRSPGRAEPGRGPSGPRPDRARVSRSRGRGPPPRRGVVRAARPGG